MTSGTRGQQVFLARLNEREVLRVIQGLGPSSRAEVVRHSGLSAPTVSKAASALLEAGLLEELDAEIPAFGRPAKKLRMAAESAQVLGVVVDAGRCRVVAAGLDGELSREKTREVETPSTYGGLIDALASEAGAFMGRPGVRTLGIGLSMPGLVDHRRGLAVFSPNLHVTDGRSPGRDLGERLGVECVMVQEQHALCLAERQYGRARGLDDFAMLDVSTGLGMGVMSGGRLLKGHNGFAGEIGHVTVDADGRLCGCGNRGCLETVANDTSLAARVSRRLGRPVDIDELVRLSRSGALDPSAEVTDVVRFLSIGLAAVINLFNPSSLFIHGRLFDLDDGLFGRVLEETGRRALGPSFAGCRIVRAQGSKRQGAVACVIQHLVDSVVPEGGD